MLPTTKAVADQKPSGRRELVMVAATARVMRRRMKHRAGREQGAGSRPERVTAVKGGNYDGLPTWLRSRMRVMTFGPFRERVAA
ncbi:hypothetical protein D3C81_648660 [compost metagenome]